MFTLETAKKPYGYQVNCHLKFGDSLHLKIKQTISLLKLHDIVYVSNQQKYNAEKHIEIFCLLQIRL